jgi:uncharacterized RDD family membrane protein YckC
MCKKYEPVLRFPIDPKPITLRYLFFTALYYMLLSTLGLENSPKNVQKYEPVLRFPIDPIPITLRYLFFTALYYMLLSTLGLENSPKMCKNMSLY